MRRIFLGTGTLVLGLATLMWTTDSISAQHSGGGNRGGHGNAGGNKGGHSNAGGNRGGHRNAGGNTAARAGSVYYSARAAPVRVGPAVRAGTVRSEHYAGSAYGGVYRNPYGAEYFRHFRPGYRPYVLGGAQYYGYGSLPLGYQHVVLNGITYFLFDGVYYHPYIYRGQTVYLVVPYQ